MDDRRLHRYDKKYERGIISMNWELVGQIIGAVGGIAVVAGAVAAFVGNLISSRIVQAHKAKLDEQLETHKDTLVKEADRHRLFLKRQELMFEREYAAASDFFKLFDSMIPDPWAPNLDWYDVQPHIAENFPANERRLKAFMEKHSASLSQEVRSLITSAKSLANEGSFEVAQETHEGEYLPGNSPSDTVRAIVDKYHDLLNKAEEQLRLDLQKGSFTATSTPITSQAEK